MTSDTVSTSALQKALSCDSQSAFGGIIVFNTQYNAETANAIKDLFVEVSIAPSFTEDVKNTLLAKPNLRVLEACDVRCKEKKNLIKNINGGILVQNTDISNLNKATHTVVTTTQPKDVQ